MIRKRVLNTQRVRRISGGFSFIPHRGTNGTYNLTFLFVPVKSLGTSKCFARYRALPPSARAIVRLNIYLKPFWMAKHRKRLMP